MSLFHPEFFIPILTAFITGVLAIAGIIINAKLTKNSGKLSSREITETKSRDGSITKRKMEIYK